MIAVTARPATADTVNSPPISPAYERQVRYLAVCLRAFLETAEQQFVPRWPVRTPGVPARFGEVAEEYRRDRERVQQSSETWRNYNE